jgi:hypothetical protein
MVGAGLAPARPGKQQGWPLPGQASSRAGPCHHSMVQMGLLTFALDDYFIVAYYDG